MKRPTLIKKLKKYYTIGSLSTQDSIIVCSSTEKARRTNGMKFLCEIVLYNEAWAIKTHGGEYLPIEDKANLKDFIDSFVESLDYDSEYFDPAFKDGLADDLIVYDEMRRMGFEVKNETGCISCTYKDITIVIPNRHNGQNRNQIEVYQSGEKGRWSTTSMGKSYKDTLKAVWDILLPYVAERMCMFASFLDDGAFSGSEVIDNQLNMSSLTIIKSDRKQRIIEILEKALRVLKEE